MTFMFDIPFPLALLIVFAALVIAGSVACAFIHAALEEEDEWQ